jgi:hypothetical protein
LYPYLKTKFVSLHNPDNLAQLASLLTIDCIAVTYRQVLQGKIAYISDSNGKWRFGHPLDSEAFNMRKPIQLLTHPVWWIPQCDSKEGKLQSVLASQRDSNSHAIQEFLPKLYAPSEEID